MIKEKANYVLLVAFDSHLQQAHFSIHSKATHPFWIGIERIKELCELLQGQQIRSFIASLSNHVVQLFQLGLVCQLNLIPYDPPDIHEVKLNCDPQRRKLVVLCDCCGCVGCGVHPVGDFSILSVVPSDLRRDLVNFVKLVLIK